MPSLLRYVHYDSGAEVYAVIRATDDDSIWDADGEVWAEYSSGDWENFAIPLGEQGASGTYVLVFPDLAAGVYDVEIRARAGGSPAESDAVIDAGVVEWMGEAFADSNDPVKVGQIAADAIDAASIKADALAAIRANLLLDTTWTDAKAAFVDVEISSRLAPTVASRTLDVTATGAAGIDWGNIENAGTTVDLSATTIDSCDDITGDVAGSVGSVTGNVAGSTGSVSGDVGGKVLGGGAGSISGVGARVVDAAGNNVAPASTALTTSDLAGLSTFDHAADAVIVGSMNSAVVTATAIAADAITDAKIASGAVTADKIASDAITADKIASNALTNAKFANNAIGAGKIADGAFTAAKFAADSITASALAADAVSEIADAIWDEDMSGHVASGTAGALLASVGDPWGTELPGAYPPGTAGAIVGNWVDGVSDVLTDELLVDGLTIVQVMQAGLAALTGVTIGVGTPNETFYAPDGSSERIELTLGEDLKNREAITLSFD